METKVGIWIDHKQATIVSITDAGKSIKKIAFDLGQPVTSAGKMRGRNKYTPNDFVAENRLERRFESDRKDYFDQVLSTIRGASAVLILGPGEAKGELLKRMKTKKLFAGKVKLETADKMTGPQLAAKVAEHFKIVPLRKTASTDNFPKTLKRSRKKKSGK